jgi:hypothetical protein
MNVENFAAAAARRREVRRPEARKALTGDDQPSWPPIFEPALAVDATRRPNADLLCCAPTGHPASRPGFGADQIRAIASALEDGSRARHQAEMV